METGGVNEPVDPGDTLSAYLHEVIEQHRVEPRDDLVDFLLSARIDGEPLEDDHIVGTVALLLIAGIDTTWSAIGATLWHLAQHPEHRRRLLDEPDLLPTAIEEFLRAYAPVTMARKVAKDVELGGRLLSTDDWVLLPFPAANRDPDVFERADEVVLDRERNRHAAFGLGIHRCLGSNLARMELTVAVQEWLSRVPDFELADPDAVRWSTGQVRGPRTVPVRLVPSGQEVPG
jgi:cytochrome P450